jgi:hypothetical protein
MIINMTKPTIIRVEDDSFFQEREDDVDIPTDQAVTQVDEHNTPINIKQGPITRSRAKKLRTMCGSRTGGWSLPCVMCD